MLLIECENIKKYFGDRLIFELDNLKIYSNDKIGIVGINGSGKTTLMEILNNKIESDEGWVKTYGKTGYISQLNSPELNEISMETASRFNVENLWDENMSGGEKTRFKLAQATEDNNLIIFADEPTSNLDLDGIKLIEERFREVKGALVLISHDRSLLNNLCTKILEIENGKIKIYNGNYDVYNNLKKLEVQRAHLEYEEYIKEKKRLEEAAAEKKQKASSLRKTPKRMGNSEARLHKMGPQKAKANLEGAANNIVKRIEHMEVKEKPKTLPEIKLQIMDSNKINSKIIIEGKDITKIYGEKVIFENTDFYIKNPSKTALIGPNGCGKSTLIKMIINCDNGIKHAQALKIGYFSQDMNILDDDQNILNNVMKTCIHPENLARLMLARLLFKGDDVYKKVSILSGGEKVKVSMAKILLQDVNMLVLDEPTNYLDIRSLELIEEVLKEYDGSLLFVSHDRSFISKVADMIMNIDDYKINMFDGTYEQFSNVTYQSKSLDDQEVEKQVLILENQLTEVIGKLAMPSKNYDMQALDREYNEILDKLKCIKKK